MYKRIQIEQRLWQKLKTREVYVLRQQKQKNLESFIVKSFNRCTRLFLLQGE